MFVSKLDTFLFVANAAICIAVLEESIYTFIRFEVILRRNFRDFTAVSIIN